MVNEMTALSGMRPLERMLRSSPKARAPNTMATKLLAISLLFGVAACGADAGLVARAGADPVGTYEFTLIDDGERVDGGMEISGTAGAYSGRMHAEGRPDGTISTVTTGGNQMTVTVDFPGLILLVRLEFDGESFSGDWSMRGQGGAIEGRRALH